MSAYKKIGFDILALSEAFNIVKQKECPHLQAWTSAFFEFTEAEQQIMNNVHADILDTIEAMNEEEIKARLIGLIFYVAHIDIPDKIRVFYERPIAAIIGEYTLNVITDCLVAAPKFNLPSRPYFFLQEFKKAKGEKKDPEAQMLTAMIIAQHINQNDKPVYGSYVIGSNWRFATLIGTDYCLSRKFDAENKNDLMQIAYTLRKLKDFKVV
jgi:hypothetical protein